MKELKWSDDEFFPLSELPEKFMDSCPLRFIDNASLSLSIVPQCEGYVKFVFDDGDVIEYGSEDDDCDDSEQNSEEKE